MPHFFSFSKSYRASFNSVPKYRFVTNVGLANFRFIEDPKVLIKIAERKGHASVVHPR